MDEIDGEVVGFAGVEVSPGFDHADLFGPLVAPSHRGQKIGTVLLEAAIERAENRSARRVVGAVGARNATGRLLLERAGFAPSGSATAVFRLNEADHRRVETGPAELTVRPGTPDDLDATMRLYRECFPDGSFPESAWLAGLEQGAVYIGEAKGESACDGQHRRGRPVDLPPRRDRGRARSRHRRLRPLRGSGRLLVAAIRARRSGSPCRRTTCPRSGCTGARGSRPCWCCRPSSSPCSRAPGDRPGDDGHDVPRPRRSPADARPRLPRGGAALSPARVGRAGPERALGVRACGRGRGAGRRGRGGGRSHRDRHHEPARDDDRLGSGERRAGPPRHRLAGPANGRAVQGAPRRSHPRPDGARPRPVLLGDEARVDPQRGLGRPGLRDGRLVAHLEAHRRSRACDRRLQRLANAAPRPRDARLGRRAARALRRPALRAPRDRQLERDDRRGRDLRGPRPDRRRCRRPAGSALRTGVFRARSGEGDIRHGRLSPGEQRLRTDQARRWRRRDGRLAARLGGAGLRGRGLGLRHRRGAAVAP